MIPLAPQTALALGAFNRVPVMQGSNHDEFRFFTALLFDLTTSGPLTPAEYPIAVQDTLAAEGLQSYTKIVLAQYPLTNYPSPDLAFSALTTDAVFCTPAYVTDLLLAARTPLYAYEFSDENAPQDFLAPVSFPYAAAHGSELQFIYDSLFRVAPVLSPDEARLAATMVGYWTRFAADASPNAHGAPQWAHYAGLVGNIQSLVPPTPHLFFGFAPEHKVPFWIALSTAAALKSGTLANKPYLTLRAARSAARTLRPSARRK
jgi:para-nitrobenzyl esterase